MMKSRYKLLFFDLDGTLLNSQKYISDRTAQAVMKCREKGMKIGICTSRSQFNCLAFVEKIQPDIMISSGGALVYADGAYISRQEFSVEETRRVIQTVREQIDPDCEITVDTVSAHYWNYKVDPSLAEETWGDSIYTDYAGFDQPSLKFAVEVLDEGKTGLFFDLFRDYDCVRFTDGHWHKITKKNITKEKAIRDVVDHYGCSLEEVMAFGDDLADMGMLEMCGCGVAMGNALDQVKAGADRVIGTNDEDGIAIFLEEELLA